MEILIQIQVTVLHEHINRLKFYLAVKMRIHDGKAL